MGKKVHLGVNNVPRNVTKIYVGVNGVARKVIKGYVGVNGVARVFWDGGRIVGGFWFFYKTANNDVLITRTNSGGTANFKKYTNGITFFFMARTKSPDGTLSSVYRVGFLSTDSNAVDCRMIPSDAGMWTGSLQHNGDTWYYRYSEYTPGVHSTFVPSGCILNKAYTLTQESLPTLPAEIVTDVLERIYTNDFAEDYQVGQTYNLPAADIEKTVRKAIAIFLFKNAPLIANRNSYQSVLSNVETIVNHVLNDKGNYDKIHIVLTIPNDTDIWCTVYYSNDSVSNVTLSAYGSGVETAYKLFTFYNPTIQYYKYTQIRFLSSGSVTHQSASYTGVMTRTVGVAVTDNIQAYHGGHQVWLTNLGLKWGKTIYSTLYPNANVYDAGTVAQTNGTRSPITKRNDGDSVVFISKNATTWDNKWIYTCCIALTYDAAILDAPNEGLNISTHVINGTTYYFSLHTGHPNYDGATEVTTPIGVPMFDELFICNPNTSPTTQRVTEIIQMLGIQT